MRPARTGGASQVGAPSTIEHAVGSRRQLKGSIALFCAIGWGVLIGCRHRQSGDQAFIPNTGQIQILNGCGLPGAAEAMRNRLSDLGFDVVEFGNAEEWTYAQSMVVARTENILIARDLAKILGIGEFVQLIDSSRMVEATLYVGEDFHSLLP